MMRKKILYTFCSLSLLANLTLPAVAGEKAFSFQDLLLGYYSLYGTAEPYTEHTALLVKKGYSTPSPKELFSTALKMMNQIQKIFPSDTFQFQAKKYESKFYSFPFSFKKEERLKLESSFHYAIPKDGLKISFLVEEKDFSFLSIKNSSKNNSSEYCQAIRKWIQALKNDPLFIQTSCFAQAGFALNQKENTDRYKSFETYIFFEMNLFDLSLLSEKEVEKLKKKTLTEDQKLPKQTSLEVGDYKTSTLKKIHSEPKKPMRFESIKSHVITFTSEKISLYNQDLTLLDEVEAEIPQLKDLKIYPRDEKLILDSLYPYTIDSLLSPQKQVLLEVKDNKLNLSSYLKDADESSFFRMHDFYFEEINFRRTLSGKDYRFYTLDGKLIHEAFNLPLKYYLLQFSPLTFLEPTSLGLKIHSEKESHLSTGSSVLDATMISESRVIYQTKQGYFTLDLDENYYNPKSFPFQLPANSSFYVFENGNTLVYNNSEKRVLLLDPDLLILEDYKVAALFFNPKRYSQTSKVIFFESTQGEIYFYEKETGKKISHAYTGKNELFLHPYFLNENFVIQALKNKVSVFTSEGALIQEFKTKADILASHPIDSEQNTFLIYTSDGSLELLKLKKKEALE